MEKKKMPLPLVILLIGIVTGLLFAVFGGIKQINANKINEERKQAAQKQSEEAVEKAKARLKEIEEEYYPLKEELEKKEQECNSMNMRASDWYANVTKCRREASDLKQKINSLEIEDTAIKSADYRVYYELVKPMTYYIFYIIGGSIAALAALGTFIIYLVKGKPTY